MRDEWDFDDLDGTMRRTPAVARRVMPKQTDLVLGSQAQIAEAIARNETWRRSLDKKAVMRATRFD